MRSHRLVLMAAAAVLVAAAGTAAANPSASAIPIPPNCGGTTFVANYGIQGSPPGQIWVYAAYQYNTCPGSIYVPVSISKYVTGVGWEQVAFSNQSYAVYNCTGGRFLYTTSETSSNDSFYCG